MNVMKRAWEIAREGVSKFGGKVKEYLAEALKLAWKEAQSITDVKVESSSNLWENYGKRRLYIDIKISLVEIKTIRGNKIGALRRMTRKMYYDLENEKLVTVSAVDEDTTRAADNVVSFMHDKINAIVTKKIAQIA